MLLKSCLSARSLPEWDAKEGSSKMYMGQDVNLGGSNRFLQAKKQEREKQQLSFFRERKTDKECWQLLPNPCACCATDSPAFHGPWNSSHWLLAENEPLFPFIFPFKIIKTGSWEMLTLQFAVYPADNDQPKAVKSSSSDTFCLTGPSFPPPGWLSVSVVW